MSREDNIMDKSKSIKDYHSKDVETELTIKKEKLGVARINQNPHINVASSGSGKNKDEKSEKRGESESMILKTLPNSTTQLAHPKTSDNSEFDYKHADKALINFLAEAVKNTLITYRLKCNGRHRHLISTKLAKRIEKEIVNNLNQIEFSYGQTEIIKSLMREIIKSKTLPEVINKFVGSLSEEQIFNIKSFESAEKTGLCSLYAKSLDLNEIDSYGYCITLDDGKTVSREKKTQTAFFVLMIDAADNSQLSQLKCESSSDYSSLRTLRQTHCFFSKHHEKDTGRYKKYVNYLDKKLFEDEEKQVINRN